MPPDTSAMPTQDMALGISCANIAAPNATRTGEGPRAAFQPACKTAAPITRARTIGVIPACFELVPRSTLLAVTLLASLPAQAQPATFNAIAVDSDVAGAPGDGSYGLGQGSTAAEAAAIAMSNCRLGGHVACKVELTFKQCAAYAASQAASGVGTGPNIPEAADRARAACGEATCRLVVADCVASSLLPKR